MIAVPQEAFLEPHFPEARILQHLAKGFRIVEGFPDHFFKGKGTLFVDPHCQCHL